MCFNELTLNKLTSPICTPISFKQLYYNLYLITATIQLSRKFISGQLGYIYLRYTHPLVTALPYLLPTSCIGVSSFPVPYKLFYKISTCLLYFHNSSFFNLVISTTSMQYLPYNLSHITKLGILGLRNIVYKCSHIRGYIELLETSIRLMLAYALL